MSGTTGPTARITGLLFTCTSVSPQAYEDQSSLQGDVNMSPVSETQGDLWNGLKTFASGLHIRDPCALAPDESVLSQIFRQYQHELGQDEKRKQNHHKRCGSLVDEVMISPPLSHQPLPSQPPPASSNSVHSESPCTEQDQDTEMAEARSDFTTFTNVRHHPYRRSEARCQPLPGSVPKWAERKAFARNRSPNEENSKPREAFAGRNYGMHVQAKIISQARLHIIEAGGRWNEEAFSKKYGSQVLARAEYLVKEELAGASTNVNKGRYAQVFQDINTAFEQRDIELEKAESIAHAAVQEAKALDEAIAAHRLELKMLRVQRKQYPTDRKELEDRPRQATASRAFAAKHHRDLISSLLSMQQGGWDVHEAWTALLTRFNLPANNAFGTEAFTSARSSAHSRASPTCDSAIPSADPGPHRQPSPTPTFTPDQQSSSYPPSSPFSQPRESQPLNYTYLPTTKPLSNAERLEFYERCWISLHSTETVLMDEHASFEQMPWPVLFVLQKNQLGRLGHESIHEFIFHPERIRNLSVQLGQRPHLNRIKQFLIQREFLRWHPDKIRRILPKFIPEDREAVEAASLKIAQYLNEVKEL